MRQNIILTTVIFSLVLGLVFGTVTPTGAQKVKLELWTFVNTHARWFRSMAEDYKKSHPNFDIEVSEIAYEEMHDKLLVALQTGVGAPDLADVEQGRFGDFLRGKRVPFVDLTDKLKDEGYLDKLVASREALYSWKGRIYGIEHALCPVVLYYRKDILKKAGIAVPIQTWEDFVEAGKKISTEKRKMIALHPSLWPILMRQRGVGWFDAQGNLTADSPKAIDTLQWMIDLRDKYRIADEPPGGNVYNPAWYGALKEGAYVTHPGADWYAGFLKDNVAELSGKWGAMPLPYWKTDPDKRRTSCLGGTGNTITITSKHQQEAWEFQKYTMLSVEGNVRRYLMTNLWPPFKPAWEDDRLYSKDPYFGGQFLGKLFAELGSEVPPQHQSPYLSRFASGAEEWQSTYWRKILDGEMTVKEAVAEMCELVRREMKR